MNNKFLVNQEDNHNKYYLMIKDNSNDESWNITYGALGKTAKNVFIDSNKEAEKTFNSKIKKGYKELSEEEFLSLQESF